MPKQFDFTRSDIFPYDAIVLSMLEYSFQNYPRYVERIAARNGGAPKGGNAIMRPCHTSKHMALVKVMQGMQMKRGSPPCLPVQHG